MRLVLIGGGLGHIHFIRNLQSEDLGDTEIILVNSKPHVFYRPAFTSVLQGETSLQEASIDLRKISTLAGVTFIQDEVEFVHKETGLVKFANRASVQYDYLSIDDVEGDFNQLGDAEHILYVKDFIPFFKQLDELKKGVAQLRPNPFQVAVVGGDCFGVGLSLHCVRGLRELVPNMKWEIFEQKGELLTGYHPRLRKKVEAGLKKEDILFHNRFEVSESVDHLLQNEESKCSYDADVILSCVEASIPKWIEKSGFPMTPEGLVESHPNFTLKQSPEILVGGRLVGSVDTVVDAKAISQNLVDLVHGRKLSCQKTTESAEESFFDLPNKKTLGLKWGFAKESQSLWVERDEVRKAELEHLRGLKEQKKARLLPTIENKSYKQKLQIRLALDINPKILESILSEKLTESSPVDHWCEKEYKDVFNDHYLSGYHTGLDILDQGYIAGGVPRYLRLYVSSPSSMKDVEILSQIIIGAYRAVRDHCELRVHVCSQAMNTVQFSLGNEMKETAFLLPEPVAYIAVTQPLGLYGLLSQQGKDIWEGQWLSDIWKDLERTHKYLPNILDRYRRYTSVVQLSEQGLVNDMVESLGEEAWRICLNLRSLPRWDGVDHLIKQSPKDSLVETNWKKGFRYWSGNGENRPDAQYLLWEPHVVRPSACILVDPSVARDFALDLKKRFNQEITFIGYAEKTLDTDQTVVKFSDWELDMAEEVVEEPVKKGYLEERVRPAEL